MPRELEWISFAPKAPSDSFTTHHQAATAMVADPIGETLSMPKLIALMGAPGVGKTTLAAQRWPPPTKRLSLDDIRARLTSAADQSITPAAVTELQRQLHKVLGAGIDVVVDATNAAYQPDRAMLLDIASAYAATPHAVIVTTTLTTALRRNATRERQVPTTVVARMHADIQRLTDAELRSEGWKTVERIIN